jgi:hypothetical protein
VKKALLFLFFYCASFLGGNLLLAQTDSVVYSKEFEFKEGIYLNFEQFKKNKPIAKEKIKSNYDKSAIDFLNKVVSKSSFTYIDEEGKEQTIKTKNIWGFSKGVTIFINFGYEFNRVVVIGSLCHFSAIMPVMFTAPVPMSNGVNQTNYQINQMVLNLTDGKIIPFDVKNMEVLLKPDEQLYAEFMALKKKKKKQSVFIYLRKYNEKHPIYFRQ